MREGVANAIASSSGQQPAQRENSFYKGLRGRSRQQVLSLCKWLDRADWNGPVELTVIHQRSDTSRKD